MRSIKDIIKELESHPDYINRGTIWTIDNIIGDISWDLDYKPLTLDMFTDEDWSMIKSYISDRAISYVMDRVPYDIKLLSFYEPVQRDKKLNKLLNDKDETENKIRTDLRTYVTNI